MELETTKIIDRYLSGELSEMERKAFEEKLKTSEQLQKEVVLQKTIQEAAVRASFRTDVQRAAKRYRLNRIVKWGATGLGIVAIIVSTSIWLSSEKENKQEKEHVSIITHSLMDQLSPNADFDPLPVQYFSVPKEGDIFLSDQSVLLSIPSEAFLLSGKLYAGEAIVQFQEAIQANEIVKANLSTMSGNDLLETQGMFSIHAYTPKGEKLEINPEVGVYVQVPVEEYKAGMQLYDFVELKNGKTDWQNPRGLSKIPVPVDMNDLDFYPEGYETQLDQLKWKRQKSKRDSLYLSFENYCSLEETESHTKTETPENIAESTTEVARSVELRSPITKSMIVPFPAIEAQFQGGGSAMSKYISQNVNYPDLARERGISGRVYINFEVDEYGFISNVKTTRTSDPILNKEAERVVRNMPRWIPAETNGQKVRTSVRIPINFVLGGVENKSVEQPGVDLMLGRLPRKKAPTPPTISEIMEVQPQDEAALGAIESVDSIIADTSCDFPHISPSKVLAFWNPKFNNTNLSTREFERRMKAIHRTCNDQVLKKYTYQLKKPISEIDRDVVNMGYSDFGSFAREQVGVVNPNNPHLENIKSFYEKGVTSLKEQADKNEDWERQLRNQWDDHLSKLRSAHSAATEQNKNESTKQEVAYNQKRTVQKLGLNNQRRLNPVAAYPQFRRTIGFTARRSGGYNCDRSVRRIITYQASLRSIQNPKIVQARKIERLGVTVDVKNGTETRETFSVTSNGKTRTIAYNSLSFGVNNPEKYDRIVAYLLPHQLETYQLLDGDNGNFATSLNDDIIYDLCIVGITDEKYFYFQKQTFNGGSLGLIDLKRTSETKLDASILQMNAKRTVKAISMVSELNWIKAEKKQFKEINRRREMSVFRERIAGVIYPCYESQGEVQTTIPKGNTRPFGI